MLHTTCSRDRSCFCSLICFKTFRSRAGRIKVPNSPRKTSSYQLPTAWCANTPAIQASTKNRMRTSPAHLLEATSKEECWGETAYAAEPFMSRNESERICFRGLTSACNGQQRHGTETWQPVGEPFLFLMKQSWKKVILLSTFFFPHRPTTQSIFCIQLRRKSPSHLSLGMKGREEKIYLHKKS